MPQILVRLPNWVGDAVMATPAIHLLREIFPDARIDALARPKVAGILAGNPDLNEVILSEENQPDRATFNRLKSRRYDAIVLMTNSFASALLAWRLRIPRRIGYSRNYRRALLIHPLRYDSYDWQTPTPKPLSRKSIKPLAAGDLEARTKSPRDSQPAGIEGRRPFHMVDYYCFLALWTVEALGFEPDKTRSFEPGRMVVEIIPEAAERVEGSIREQGLSGKTLIGIHPGAAYGGAKKWPMANLAAAADMLARKFDAKIVSTASRFEKHLNDEIVSLANEPISRLGEMLDLPQLAALIDRLELLVTNDSGPMHIAAARQTPVVAIFGPTDWNVTRPYNAPAEVVRQSPECAPCFLRECPIDHRCMTRISPEMVVEAAERLLARCGVKP